MSIRWVLSGIVLLGTAAMLAQQARFEGAPAIAVGNDRLDLLILPQGSSIASIVLKGLAAKINPLWNPMRLERGSGEAGDVPVGDWKFPVPGWIWRAFRRRERGRVADAREAHEAQWETRYSGKTGSTTALTLATTLPIVQENVERTYRLVDGETVVYVETQVESLLGFDRPMVWAEHATAGSPFLEPGVTLIEMSATRSQTRPYLKHGGGLPDRFASGKDFTWPWAVGTDGKRVDMRTTPANPNSGGHTTSLMDRKRKLAFITFFNPKMGLLLGYLFKPEEFPWVQSWENFPPSRKLARGLEFSTQPYDVPRREAIQMRSMFDTPTYRWLPAKSRVTSRSSCSIQRRPRRLRKWMTCGWKGRRWWWKGSRIAAEDHAGGEFAFLGGWRACAGHMLESGLESTSPTRLAPVFHGVQ